MNTYKLYFFLLGCTPPNRHIEQHDVFFGIGTKPADLIPALQGFWPEAKLHIDCWREVTSVDGFSVRVVPKQALDNQNGLYFLNLGGYRMGAFEEFHYKSLIVAASKADAIKKAKQTSFYKEFGFKGAVAHVDDAYGVDIDDVFNVVDILSVSDKERFSVLIGDEVSDHLDVVHLGYMTLAKFKALK